MLSLTIVGLLGMAFAGCTPSAEQMKSLMQKNPEIMYAAIEASPEKFLEVVNKAAREAQAKQRENAAKEEEKAMEEELKNPKAPAITDATPMRGKKDAAITVVEYSDFECPYCGRGYETVRELEKKYGEKMRFVYKNLPLDFHPNAMPAAKWFAALTLQSAEKAYKFHDEVFSNQGKLREGGAKFLEAAAKKAGGDVAKAKKDMEGEAVKKLIAADMEEAKKFGFTGTPGFLVNGVSLRGAYPVAEFEKIIEKVTKK